MKKNEMERRSYTSEIRREQREAGGSMIGGRAIVYGRATDIGGVFEEVIEPGALDGADLTDVPLLVNHNDRMIPVARSRRNTPGSTLRLNANEFGLDFEADLDTERNMTARELDSAVERKDLDGCSFRFSVKEERWENLDSDYPRRHIIRFDRIGEISAVTWPAYESTELYARSKEALESARSALESARQQDAEPLESGDEIELLKAKTIILTEGITNA